MSKTVDPKGYSLHIALDAVDEKVYGTRALLNICENDADAYAEIALDQHFCVIKKLYGAEATGRNFNQHIECLAEELVAGDLLLLTFSGHGGQIPDVDNDEEGDYDQTWCFYDGHVPDDHLFSLWPKFKAGVRILVVSDSCHSGDMLRDLFNADPFSQKVARSPLNASLSRGLGNDPFSKPGIQCSIQLLAAAQKDRYAEGGQVHSLFTQAMLDVWDAGLFEGTYDSFFDELKQTLPGTKVPGRMVLGRPPFNHERPFTI